MDFHDLSVAQLAEKENGVKTFEAMVTADVKGTASAEESAFLRQPENLDQFYSHLIDMLRSFELQLTRQRIRSLESRHKAIADGTITQWELDHIKVMEWRRTMNNLRRYVEARLREIRMLRANQVKVEAIPDVLTAAETLIRAIEAHQKLAANDNATEDQLFQADLDLWGTLHEPTVEALQRRLDQLPK